MRLGFRRLARVSSLTVSDVVALVAQKVTTRSNASVRTTDLKPLFAAVGERKKGLICYHAASGFIGPHRAYKTATNGKTRKA
jgi:hypothetical protein